MKTEQAGDRVMKMTESVEIWEGVDEGELVQVASQIKRFFERWQADPNFRECLLIAPHKAVTRYDLRLDPEVIRPLWDPKFSKRQCSVAEVSSSTLLKSFQTFIEKFKPSDIREEILAAPKDPRFRAWRERQMARMASLTDLQGGVPIETRAIPVCFELSKGCSVGCWFCGVSAPKLDDIFAYSQEKRQLWRQVLGLMRQILGPIASAGFCYFATDPLDNPDYEKFCSDFHEVLGVFPQTTTAQPLRDPVRMRKLLELSLQKGKRHNRFSILSLRMLDKVHAEFSAEELAFVGLELQNKEAEADEPKVNVGRARERYKKNAETAISGDDDLFQGTISIITGFLFNMVERSVKLISPCIANERWPDGHRIHDQGTFSDISNLQNLLETMISKHMPLTLRPSNIIHFRPDLNYESLPDGFQVSTPFKTFRFRQDTYAKRLGETIRQSNQTAEAIATVFAAEGIAKDHVFQSLNLLFERGVLDDEPPLKEPHSIPVQSQLEAQLAKMNR